MADDRNGIFAVEGYGTRRAHCTRVTHGMKVIATEENAAKHRAWHPFRRTSGEFNLVVVHPTHQEYLDFNEFLMVYCDRISTPNNTLSGMRVVVDSVGFDRIAIPTGGIGFGRAWNDYVWVQPLSFKSLSDPVDLSVADLSIISAAYLSTYYEAGGRPGDYVSNYAIASLSEAIGNGSSNYEDALYNSRVSTIGDIPPIVGPDGSIIG